MWEEFLNRLTWVPIFGAELAVFIECPKVPPEQCGRHLWQRCKLTEPLVIQAGVEIGGKNDQKGKYKMHLIHLEQSEGWLESRLSCRYFRSGHLFCVKLTSSA